MVGMEGKGIRGIMGIEWGLEVKNSCLGEG
jgi:hypothetical protein